ncbi:MULTISPECIES: Gfo/Idh/MocA family protein [Paenibacillus]|uniref:Gfo/Idh/MocA family oxidoreductase n=1 Tax=Paenibacillus xylanilyticus TaxID=248903 RepID=A0A7Y6C1X1_9BACL|nr:Gfo/Idh/MocA family oxidoreductase [Paenibacillus xylanilyticus]NUU79097.1 Gfo/Idh/MocA family oxidoreductase [Paenibacillus xylanilyticus]
MNIGIIGLDSSHALAFTRILHESQETLFSDVTVTAAYAGGSPDFPLSVSRVNTFAARMAQEYGVRLMPTAQQVVESTDAIFILSADGRVHLDQFKAICPYRKPVFIDKPFALSTGDASQIIRLAEEYQTPLMSASSLRYAEALPECTRGDILGADVYGPMHVESTQGHYFWYGIHAAELLFRIMGPGCREVTALSTDHNDLITGTWKEGRMGTIRGIQRGSESFGLSLHTRNATRQVPLEPSYKELLKSVMNLFKNGVCTVHPSETLEVIRFLECAEQSRLQKCTVLMEM